MHSFKGIISSHILSYCPDNIKIAGSNVTSISDEVFSTRSQIFYSIARPTAAPLGLKLRRTPNGSIAISDIVYGTPAQEAGVVELRDEILTINGISIAGRDVDYCKHIIGQTVENEVRFCVARLTLSWHVECDIVPTQVLRDTLDIVMTRGMWYRTNSSFAWHAWHCHDTWNVISYQLKFCVTRLTLSWHVECDIVPTQVLRDTLDIVMTRGMWYRTNSSFAWHAWHCHDTWNVISYQLKFCVIDIVMTRGMWYRTNSSFAWHAWHACHDTWNVISYQLKFCVTRLTLSWHVECDIVPTQVDGGTLDIVMTRGMWYRTNSSWRWHAWHCHDTWNVISYQLKLTVARLTLSWHVECDIVPTQVDGGTLDIVMTRGMWYRTNSSWRWHAWHCHDTWNVISYQLKLTVARLKKGTNSSWRWRGLKPRSDLY